MSIISLFILKARLWLLCRVPMFPLVVNCFIFIKFLSPSTELLHCFAIHSHFIFVINKHKGKWVLWFDKYNDTIFSSRQIPFVQPCATIYWYLTLTESQLIWSVFISDVFSYILIVNSQSAVSSTCFCQDWYTFHHMVSSIRRQYHHYYLDFLYDDKNIS